MSAAVVCFMTNPLLSLQLQLGSSTGIAAGGVHLMHIEFRRGVLAGRLVGSNRLSWSKGETVDIIGKTAAAAGARCCCCRPCWPADRRSR